MQTIDGPLDDYEPYQPFDIGPDNGETDEPTTDSTKEPKPGLRLDQTESACAWFDHCRECGAGGRLFYGLCDKCNEETFAPLEEWLARGNDEI